MTSLQRAKILALLVPAGLLAGAYGSEIWGGLYPCEMCWWQRYAHFVALAAALLAFLLSRLPDRGRSFVWLSALGILTSGGIGAYHAGVEAGIFEGFTQCTSTATGSAEDLLKSILSAPLVRCDQVQFEFLGISMAGWNAIFSIGFGLVILWLSLRKPKRSA
ncbi:disulfide bond formation protein B [Sphingomonas parva]|uniref:Disulfide bond formation protein B n=1 Tax=Sphingomonas parva TaxID=2555898 RepID=A0A4Y8ZT30_9SPHN|nr:disulfide bond formation protein B [Sphingomonas parva]TFI59173.1 disulfide bond formation protein B [Sphingomonas parva]